VTAGDWDGFVGVRAGGKKQRSLNPRSIAGLATDDPDEGSGPALPRGLARAAARRTGDHDRPIGLCQCTVTTAATIIGQTLSAISARAAFARRTPVRREGEARS
jgi:hypothetical protein